MLYFLQPTPPKTVNRGEPLPDTPNQKHTLWFLLRPPASSCELKDPGRIDFVTTTLIESFFKKVGSYASLYRNTPLVFGRTVRADQLPYTSPTCHLHVTYNWCLDVRFELIVQHDIIA